MASKLPTVNPLELGKILWPSNRFSHEQQDIVRSVWEDDETFVPAANMMGKDYVAGFICVVFFLTRTPCRIITTSIRDDHLRVLWGEIGRWIQSSTQPLTSDKGGPLVVNHRDIRRIIKGNICPISYLRGMVSEKGEGMAGHHVANVGDGIPRTLWVSDEASGSEDEPYDRADTWANRKLVIGNTFPCNNFFYRAVMGSPDGRDKGGDIPRSEHAESESIRANSEGGENEHGPPSHQSRETNTGLGEGRNRGPQETRGSRGYHRRVIRITAEDSPNVRFARYQQSKGVEPTDEIVVPGVKSWGEYQRNLKLWDEISKCIKLRAEFYLGSEVLLFPPQWLDIANDVAEKLRNTPRRQARAIGIDPGEGVANTSWAAVDEYGIIEQISIKTSDTSVIPSHTIAFGKKHGAPADKWVFDRGGGGKQHADTLRIMNYKVQTIGFGEGITLDIKRGTHQLSTRKEHIEERYVYVNRRAQLYGELSLLFDPNGGLEYNNQLIGGPKGYGLPRECSELRRQLAPIPKVYDKEGRLKLPPKNRESENSAEKTLVEILGCSPDEADSVVLAVHGMVHKTVRPTAGALR